MRVKATREGLLGRMAKSGAKVDPYTPGIALPCVAALWRFVVVRNPVNKLWIVCRVLDVGPWNEQDSDYVYGGARPRAELGPDERGRITNGAGIDLWEKPWQVLEMVDNALVDWDFIDGAVLGGELAGARIGG